MLRKVQTFNAHAINDGTNYQAWVLNPNGLAPAKTIFIEQINADSQDSGAYTVDVQTVTLSVQVKNYASRVSLIAQLKSWFKRGTQGDVVVLYMDDGLTYFRTCRVVNLIQDPIYPLNFTVILQSGQTAWQAVTPDTYVWNLTGTGGNHTVNNLGDDETPLSVTFQLSAGGAKGYLYQRLYQLLNVPAPVAPLGYGPWCITLDTAALIADNANKMQINQVGGITAGLTTIPYDTVTGVIPSIGMGYVDSEQITWTGKTGTTSGNLTGVVRGVGGTTAATHADNAVIKMSLMLANCADLRIFANGSETNRWVANPNTASTNVWFIVTMNQGYNLVLRTGGDLDSSIDYPYLLFAVTPDTLAAISAMPAEGILVHGTEWLKYQKSTFPYKLILVERGVLGTTKQAHTAGVTFSYMQNVITVCYGDSAAILPASADASYDNTKPLFSLTASSNTAWVYDATSAFFETQSLGRTGGINPSIVATLGEVSVRYGIKQNAVSGDPAVGMKIGSFFRGSSWVSENARIAFHLYRSCGITTTTFTGEKYRTDTAWPNAVLQISNDGANYTDIWNEATPGSPAVWTALATHSAVAMNNATWMRFMFNGAYPAGVNSYAMFEILTGTINFVSGNLPTGSLLSQKVSAQLDLALTNGANNDELDVLIPMLVGLPLELDGEAKTVLYHNTNAQDVIALNDESRDVWVRLVPGNNSLTVAAVDVGTLAATLSWYRRRF